MAKRYGTLLVFKEGVSKSEIEKAMETLVDSGVLDERHFCKPQAKPVFTPYIINEYDDEYGGPAWYIP